MATIEKRGKNSWRATVRLSGEPVRRETFRRKSDAEKWGRDVETDLGRGVYVPTALDKNRKLGGVIDAFIAEELPLRTETSDRRKLLAQLAWWRENAGQVPLAKLVRKGTIEGFRTKLRSRTTGRRRNGDAPAVVTPATVNRYLAALSAVCKWAWQEKGWLPFNPVLSVRKGKEAEGIVRFLSDEERGGLLDACKASKDPNIYTAVVLALATGARQSNIRFLKWDDVDLDAGRLRFLHTKNDEPRYVPLVEPAKAVLQAQRDRDPTRNGWVFKGQRDASPADLDGPWRAVRKVAGLVGDKHCRFHDLRHTTGSYMTMNGATIVEVAAALGHKTLAMAQRYSHQSGEHVRGTLERMAERFLKDEANVPTEVYEVRTPGDVRKVLVDKLDDLRSGRATPQHVNRVTSDARKTLRRMRPK